MSHNCHSDICNNVANIGDVLGPLWTQEALEESFEPEELEYETDGSMIDPEFKATSAYKAGWRIKEYSAEDAPEVGKKKRLYVEIALVKGDYLVYMINSSQYNNVGETDYTAFSDNREAVEMLINDLQEWQRKVEDIDTVEQWG